MSQVTQFEQAMLAYQQQDYATAERLLQGVLAVQPQAIDALINLGNVYFQTKQFDKAEPLWRKAVEVNPLEQKAYINLGNLYFALQDWDRALDYWEIYKKLNPKHAGVSLNMALACEKLGELKRAHDFYGHFIMLNKDIQTVLVKKRLQDQERMAIHNATQAEKYLKMEDFLNAKKAYEQCVHIFPMQALIYKHYASVLFKLDELEKAAFWYERAASTQTEHDWGVYVNLGVIYDRLDRPAEALWAYRQACKFGDKGVPNRIFKHAELLMQNQASLIFDQARQNIESLISHNQFRRAETLTEKMVQVCYLTNHPQGKVFDKLSRFLSDRKNPTLMVSELHFQEAEKQFQAGHLAEALDGYNNALRFNPQSPHQKHIRDQKTLIQQQLKEQPLLSGESPTLSVMDAATDLEDTPLLTAETDLLTDPMAMADLSLAS